MMLIDTEHLVIVKSILKNYIPNYDVWAFGSRVHGQGIKPFSDLDLAIITNEPLDFHQYALLKEAFSESNLPYRVDVLDWADTNENFRKIILQNYEIVQIGETKKV